MSASREEEIAHSRELYLRRSYKECIETALPLLDEQPTLHLMQLALISLHRLGLHSALESFGRSCLALTEVKPCAHACIQLILGLIPFKEAIQQASTGLERAMVHYYAAERELSDGNQESCIAHLRDALSQGAVGVEVQMAETLLPTLGHNVNLPAAPPLTLLREERNGRLRGYRLASKH